VAVVSPVVFKLEGQNPRTKKNQSGRGRRERRTLRIRSPTSGWVEIVSNGRRDDWMKFYHEKDTR